MQSTLTAICFIRKGLLTNLGSVSAIMRVRPPIGARRTNSPLFSPAAKYFTAARWYVIPPFAKAFAAAMAACDPPAHARLFGVNDRFWQSRPNCPTTAPGRTRIEVEGATTENGLSHCKESMAVVAPEAVAWIAATQSLKFSQPICNWRKESQCKAPQREPCIAGDLDYAYR